MRHEQSQIHWAWRKRSPSNARSGVLQAPRPAIAPEDMPRITTVDSRFQSYNIETVEVTGGRFSKPHKDVDALLKAQASSMRPGRCQGELLKTSAGLSPWAPTTEGAFDSPVRTGNVERMPTVQPELAKQIFGPVRFMRTVGPMSREFLG